MDAFTLTIIIICTLISILLTAEIQVWGFTLNRHALWVKAHPVGERRVVNWKSLAYTSSLTSLLSVAALVTWIYMITLCNPSAPLIYCIWCIGTGFDLVLISYLYLIAKLCRLNKYYYPPVTVWLLKKYMISTKN